VDEHATPIVQLRGDEPGQPPNLIRWRFALDDRKVHQQLVSGNRLTGMGGREGHDDIRAPIERGRRREGTDVEARDDLGVS
jgi:hypothetical protein